MQTKSCELEDKIRLLLLYYLCIGITLINHENLYVFFSDSIDLSECQKIENSLQINNPIFIKALTYVKKQKVNNFIY